MRRGLCIAALVATASLATASSAGAAPLPLPSGMPPQLVRAAREGGEAGGGAGPASVGVPSFHLRTPNGYRVEVVPAGASLAVVVGKPNGASESAYLARGLITPRHLKASLGRFGELDMRFRPGGRDPRPSRSCRGKHKFAVDRGTFTGQFRFAGENSYVRVRVRRASGQVARLRPRCSRALFGPPGQASDSVVFYPADPISSEELGAEWRDGADAAQLLAFSGAGRVFYLAELAESRGRIAIARFAFTTGPMKGLSIDSALTSATVSPPAPFHGTGRYRATPAGEVSWEGPLAVSFPGLPRYPLTGERFQPSVWRAY